jgi:hypothetical protein
MIRRGFWLAVGATGGIMGYRRAASLGRSLTGRLDGSRQQVVRRHWARETIRFTRDVREGMDLYMTRHQSQVAPNLRASADNDEKDDR